MMLLLSSLNVVLLLVTALCSRISYSTGLHIVVVLTTRNSNNITLQCVSPVSGRGVEADFYGNSELQASSVRDFNFIITRNEGSYHCEVGGERSESKSIRSYPPVYSTMTSLIWGDMNISLPCQYANDFNTASNVNYIYHWTAHFPGIYSNSFFEKASMSNQELVLNDVDKSVTVLLANPILNGVTLQCSVKIRDDFSTSGFLAAGPSITLQLRSPSLERNILNITKFNDSLFKTTASLMKINDYANLTFTFNDQSRSISSCSIADDRVTLKCENSRFGDTSVNVTCDFKTNNIVSCSFAIIDFSFDNFYTSITWSFGDLSTVNGIFQAYPPVYSPVITSLIWGATNLWLDNDMYIGTEVYLTGGIHFDKFINTNHDIQLNFILNDEQSVIVPDITIINNKTLSFNTTLFNLKNGTNTLGYSIIAQDGVSYDGGSPFNISVFLPSPPLPSSSINIDISTSLTTSINHTLITTSASDNLPSTKTPTPTVALVDTTLIYSVIIILSLFFVMIILVVGIVIGVRIYIKKRYNITDSSSEEHARSARYDIIKNEEKGEIPLNSEHFNEISQCLISSKHVTLQALIGQGEFGIVYRAIMTSDDGKLIPIAVKTLKGLFSEGDVDSIIKESVKMSTFDHRNVLTLTGVCLELGQAPCIIMPFMANGSLLNYLKKERDNLTITEINQDEMMIANVQKQLMTICLQVAEGMNYLSLMKLVHRDLAARNCLIDSNGVIKVADFGLSENVYVHNYFRQFKSKENPQVKLPVKWMAIESLHDGIFSEKSDVWSYGVLMWEVYSLGKSPYPGLYPVGVVQLLDEGNRLTPPNNAACSDEIYKLMLSCWEADPNERPHFADLVKSINDIIKPLANYTTLISNED